MPDGPSPIQPFPIQSSDRHVFHAHRDEVARLVPHAAAKLCALWLKSVPVELGEGRATPWRKQAAELALAIGREVQALNAAGT